MKNERMMSWTKIVSSNKLPNCVNRTLNFPTSLGVHEDCACNCPNDNWK